MSGVLHTASLFRGGSREWGRALSLSSYKEEECSAPRELGAPRLNPGVRTQYLHSSLQRAVWEILPGP